MKRLPVLLALLLVLVACQPTDGSPASDENAAVPVADGEVRVKVNDSISVAPEPIAADDGAGPAGRGARGITRDATAACLNADEAELARLVNEYRTSLGLDPVALSKSLTLVAQQHAWDSETNNNAWPPPPPGETCNMHSWTDKVNPALKQGTWTPVCYTNNHTNSEGLHRKPEELAGYPGNGSENSYFYISATSGATPAGALQAWKNSPGHNALLVKSGSARPLAMGVGINGAYAHLWMGWVADPAGTATLCAGQPSPTAMPAPTATPVPTVMAAAEPPTPAPVGTASARRTPPLINENGTIADNSLFRYPFDVQTGNSYDVVVSPAPELDVAPTITCTTSAGEMDITFDQNWEGEAETFTYDAPGDGRCAVGVYGYGDSVGDFNITVKLK